MVKFRRCEICGIKSERKDGRKRLFMAKYPLNEFRCKKWVQVTGKEDLVYDPIEKLNELKYVCGGHFKEKDFNKKKTRIKKSAVPSLGLTAKPLPDLFFKEFPCRIFKEARCNDENEIPSTSTASYSTLEVLDEVLLDTEIPRAEHFVEVCTSEQQSVSARVVPAQYVRQEHGPESTYSVQHVERKRRSVPDGQLVTTKRIIPSKNNTELSPRKKKLMKRISQYKNKIKIIEKQLKAFTNIKSKALKTMILSAAKNQNRTAQGKRWSNNDKALAIAMFKKSPKLYRFIRQLIPLPSIRTLQNILSKMPIHTGFNKIILDHLRRKASEMTNKDRVCVLMFDEMSLKRRLIYNSASDFVEGYQDLGEHGRTEALADKALVLMLQGVHKQYKQPIAHYFVSKTISSEKLTVIIKNAIKILSEIAYKVIATVCDQGPTNVGALNLLKKHGN